MSTGNRPMVPAQSLADLRPGDIGFGPLTGWANLATVGQLILGEGFRIGTLNVGHVFVVTDNPGDGTVQLVEAMPRGARSIWIEPNGNGLNADRWTSDYAYVRLPEDYPGQAEDAAAVARAMVGTPYSFLSYAYLAAWKIKSWAGFDRFPMTGVGRLEKWINRRRPAVKLLGLSPEMMLMPGIALPCEAICSVLADQAWSLTGKRIMHGVGHQCVTPGGLAGRLLEMASPRRIGEQTAVWTWPGRP